MKRISLPMAVAALAGVTCVYAFPPSWLAPVSAAAAVIGIVFCIIVRVGTKTEPNANPAVGLLLSVANLPEQPLAEAKPGWALTGFLASASFLVALGLAVMARAYA